MLLQRLEALSYRPGRSTASGQPTYLKRLFRRFDVNRDGNLDADEFVSLVNVGLQLRNVHRADILQLFQQIAASAQASPEPG